MSTSFEFKQCMSIPKSTGRKARSLSELRDAIAGVSGESLYRHTYQYFLKGHIREHTNDFAHWVGESLEERALSEQLSNIDPYIYKNPDELRTELLKVMDDYLASYPEPREAIFSVSRFVRAMAIDELIIPPSIDPLSEKNRDLTDDEIRTAVEKFEIPENRPILLQVSRFDRFKDPIGVIKAYRLVKKYNDCILILAGSPASDDPEGEAVLGEVKAYAADDPDIHILLLPPFSDKDINALQRLATVVLQKSLKEGFGLTVSEAMWKGKPVLGGAIGGIPLQIEHGITGFLVHSVEGAAFRIRQLLNNPEMANRMGERARELVRTNFLITRQVRDYLAVWYAMLQNGKTVLEL